MSARSNLQWLGRSLLSLLTALLRVGVGAYLRYRRARPGLQPWLRANLDAEFTAADDTDGRVTTLARYRERERRLLAQVDVRGETGVSNVPNWLLARQRSNPFHGYLVARVERWLGVPAAAVALSTMGAGVAP